MHVSGHLRKSSSILYLHASVTYRWFTCFVIHICWKYFEFMTKTNHVLDIELLKLPGSKYIMENINWKMFWLITCLLAYLSEIFLPFLHKKVVERSLIFMQEKQTYNVDRMRYILLHMFMAIWDGLT